MITYKIADSVIYAEFDKSWGIEFYKSDETQSRLTRTGFKSEDEAKGFMDGWNSSRREIADLLLRATINGSGSRLEN